MRAQCLQVGGERRIGGQQPLDRHRRGDVGLAQQRRRVVDGETEHPEDRVGAVGDGEALLLGELDRAQSGTSQRLAAGHPVAVEHRFALAEQDERGVGERGEIAAGAEGPVLGHDRRDAGVEHVDHRLGDDRPGAAEAERQRAGAQQHHRPHHLLLDRRAHPGGVGADERGLQRTAALGRDGDGGQRAEPGGDAVARLTLGQPFDDRPGRGHPCHCRVGQRDLLVAAGDGDDVGDGHAGPVEAHGHETAAWAPMPMSLAIASVAVISAASTSRRVARRNRYCGPIDRDGHAEPVEQRVVGQRPADRGDVGLDGAGRVTHTPRRASAAPTAVPSSGTTWPTQPTWRMARWLSAVATYVADCPSLTAR